MKRKQYTRGLRVGVPISLGYLAVAFTMGITARNAGLSAVQATLTSFLVNASAGQYAAFTLMAAQGGYLEMAILELVTNARYLLMSCSLSQKLSPKTKLWQRLTVGFAVTDEMFGMAIAEPEEVSPWYYFGMMSIAIPGWSLGTFLGTTVGNILLANVVSLPVFAGIASGTKLILLTVVLSAGAALLFPVKDEEPGEEETP